MQAVSVGWSGGGGGRGEGGGSNHYNAFRRTVALRIFLLCSRVGRHIPLALLSGLFPAAGGFCPPLPHCPGFLCSLTPTMAFFLPLNIYLHFLPLCVLFVLFCCLPCFSFLLLQSWETAQAHTHKPELICSSSLWFRPLSLNLSSLFLSPIIHCDTHTHKDNKLGWDLRCW